MLIESRKSLNLKEELDLLYVIGRPFKIFRSFGFTAKFVVSLCAFCKLRRDFGFFFSVNHFLGGSVNANHNI